MDFFKSVFSEDQFPTSPDHNPDVTPTSPSNSDSNSNSDSPQSPNPDDKPKFPSIANSWTTFGSSLLKTVATKSESVIGNYRRDLEEFSSGLRKETAIIREAASRAVKDLPGRLESGAAVAQTSLESVGQAIDNIGGAVSEIIVHGKDSIFNSADDVDSDVEFETGSNKDKQNLKPYNRLEAVIRTVQCDIRTYCEEPEEAGEYLEWKKDFVLEDLGGEIEDLVKENEVIGEIYDEVVPGKVDRETFWTRYFYKVYRVKKAEEARMKLVKRAIEGEEEEELSWDVDDDEEQDENNGIKAKEAINQGVEESEKEVGSLRPDHDDKPSASKVRSEAGDEEQGVAEGRSEENDLSGEKLESKMDDRGSSSEGRNDNVSDFSVVSSQPSEVDIGWDEIEDIGSGDEAKLPVQRSPDTVDLRRGLIVAADEEEDLPWDIEDDDDEPAKS
ncbi:OLC1v1020238C1 [Oldenlandia corymbosa var. corymbosa]|uniref:OLC1v1020238C1 n=1 Tax=Oldenlandia corymbosa var. corymbosa TaxID=529605 RepID=A0AAV1EFV9_OLDCO|nr:OLC1v1020238C1 [Oldenlandia corymbosa var. corymbosa]